jgi:hypothetical protein
MVTENIIMLKTFIAFDQNKIIYDKKKSFGSFGKAVSEEKIF